MPLVVQKKTRPGLDASLITSPTLYEWLFWRAVAALSHADELSAVRADPDVNTVAAALVATEPSGDPDAPRYSTSIHASVLFGTAAALTIP